MDIKISESSSSSLESTSSSAESPAFTHISTDDVKHKLYKTLSKAELMQDIIDMSDYSELEAFYDNLDLKEIIRIAGFYNIVTKKYIDSMKHNIHTIKDELITKIIMFETNKENIEKIYNRKKMWYYLNNLRNNQYMKQFVME